MNNPYLSKDLIDWIDGLFPEQSPSKEETEKNLYWRGGQREVVRFLIHRYQEQESLRQGKEIQGIKGGIDVRS